MISINQIIFNLIFLISKIISLIKITCLIAGIFIILGSLLQIIIYRKNPKSFEFIEIFFLFIIGTILLIFSNIF